MPEGFSCSALLKPDPCTIDVSLTEPPPCRVCTVWRAAANAPAPWQEQRQHDFPAADEATLAVLLERVQRQKHPREPHGKQLRRQEPLCAERQVYERLSQQWVCDRCSQASPLLLLPLLAQPPPPPALLVLQLRHP